AHHHPLPREPVRQHPREGHEQHHRQRLRGQHHRQGRGGRTGQVEDAEGQGHRGERGAEHREGPGREQQGEAPVPEQPEIAEDFTHAQVCLAGSGAVVRIFTGTETTGRDRPLMSISCEMPGDHPPEVKAPMRLRQLLVIALSLSLLGISAPAWSQADSDDCRDLMAADTPAYVVCRWMATPEEAADIARFWLDDDGRNMRDAGPMDPIGVDCREPGNECPTDLEGDGELHDVGSPGVEGAEDGGQPECETAEPCYVDPDAVTGVTLSGITPSAQAVKTAAARGVRVWIDTELADDHQAGKLAEAAKKVAALAAQPGVAGIRFSTGLGQDQRFATADELDAFVTAASAELRKLAPGKKLAVHTSVPALGCGAVAECTKTLTEQQPLLDPDRIGGWLTRGLVDQLILDSGHLAT